MRLLSQLAHVELTTTKPQESLDFWTQIVGLEETERAGQSVYLRAWGDRFHHTLKLTEGPQVTLDHIGWRADGPEQLERAVQQLTEAGVGEGWDEYPVGHGRAFRYRAPGGHLNEIFWEVERYVAPEDKRSPFPNRPQRFVPRGIAARCIDHVTITAPDPWTEARWYQKTLGHRFMEYTAVPGQPDVVIFAMTTTCERAHDLGIVRDFAGHRGRVNHFAYFVDSREELIRAADIFLNQGVAIEYGPGRHGMGDQDYLYVRDPSGMRVEINAGGYRNYEPDWEPIQFDPQIGSLDFYLNRPLPESFSDSFPPVEGAPPSREEMAEQTGYQV